MNTVIKKSEKNKIMVLGGIAGCLGAVAASVGLYLRTEITKTDLWDVNGIIQFTNGYFGIMSGFLLFLLGTAGYGLVYTRIFCLVFIYELFSFTCDVLCVFDVVMVMPYTQENGRFAWRECEGFYNTTNIHHTNNESCDNVKIIAILLILIPTTLLVALVFSIVTTVLTTVALCRARGVSATDQSDVQMSPFRSELDNFQPTSYGNALRENPGFRP